MKMMICMSWCFVVQSGLELFITVAAPERLQVRDLISSCGWEKGHLRGQPLAPKWHKSVLIQKWGSWLWNAAHFHNGSKLGQNMFKIISKSTKIESKMDFKCQSWFWNAASFSHPSDVDIISWKKVQVIIHNNNLTNFYFTASLLHLNTYEIR